MVVMPTSAAALVVAMPVVQVVEKPALAFRCEAKSVRPDPCFGIDST
ncbi:hypothetical protein ACWGEU_28240 [Streptomyces goshikiensis]